jgi:hypothetical protein
MEEILGRILPLPIFASGETATGRLLFLFRRCFFLGCGFLGFGFCGHNFIFLRLTYLRHGSFSEGDGIMRAGLSVVNGGRKIFSVLFRVASFLFFPVTMRVDDQQQKNNEARDNENDDDGLVTPHIAYKI